MNTLFDFITHIKGVEYLLAIMFIVVFIIFWEALKPRPFHSLVVSGRSDIDFIRKTGGKDTFRTIGRLAEAPFIGLAYLVSLPFVFVYGLVSLVGIALKGAVGPEKHS